jgi:hypothetical protein
MDSSAKRVIEIRRIGFQPLSLNLDPWPDSAIRVVLSAATRTLTGVTILASRSRALAGYGFYERMADVERGINHGFFVTPEEIEARPGARVTDFLQGRAGVRVQLVKDCPPWEDCRQGLQPQGINGCRLEIYLDGARFYSLGGAKGVGHINELLSPNSVAAIEVYPRSVSAPPRYQSLNGTCGVMLIWTK